MLDPDTAPKGRSIWNDIDRLELERQTTCLANGNYVPEPKSYASATQRSTSASYPIPFELERQLADDFAFIAAFQPQVDSVSAVAIELGANHSVITVRVAANEGVSSEVGLAFDDVLGVLRKCAQRGKLPCSSMGRFVEVND